MSSINSKILIGAVVVILLIAGVWYVSTQNSRTAGSEQAAMMKKEAPGQEAMEKKEGAQMKDTTTDTVLAGKNSQYLKFTTEEYEEAMQSGKVVFLDFYANWCPLCRNEETKLFEGFNELTTDQVIGFRVNYNDTDTDQAEKDLAKKYGVTYQTTKVILKNGKQLLKITEEWDKETFLSEINKALNS